jgi:anti-sigma factor RsiW
MPRFRLPWRRRGAGAPGLACQEIVELVTAYVEGVLDPADKERFEAHISGCDACTEYVAQMRATIETLGRLPVESLSPAALRELELAFADWKSGG